MLAIFWPALEASLVNHGDARGQEHDQHGERAGHDPPPACGYCRDPKERKARPK